MAEAAVASNDFITKDVFNVHVRSMRDRADSEEKLSDARFDRIEALLQRNLSEQRRMNERLEGKIENVVTRLSAGISENRSEIKALRVQMATKEELSAVKNDVKALKAQVASKENLTAVKDDVKALNVQVSQMATKEELSEVKGDIKAIIARLDTQQTKFGWYLTLFGLVITVVVAAIQFWK